MIATPDSFVTVVSGLPRSGTSMMMQMLEAGGIAALTDRVRTADADNPRGYYEYEPVKKTKQDSAWVSLAVGKAVKLVHVLLVDLPAGYRYRVLFMRRQIDQVLASQQAMLQRQGKQGAALTPQRLATVFLSQLEKVDAWLAERSNFQVLKVDYNQMLQTPAEQVPQVNQFLGCHLDTDAMIRVVDKDLYRQRG